MRNVEIYKIKNEQDFWKAYKHSDKCLRNVFYLENDIVFHEKKKVYIPNSIVISGNHHSIYYSQDFSFEGSFIETTLVPYREVVKLKKCEDLEKLRTIKNGTIVVEVLKDLDNYHMNTIRLKDFHGHIIILGNHHVLSNIAILGQDYNGLFWQLSSSASLKVKDLTFDHILLSHEEAKYTGFLIGVHSTYPEFKLREVCSPVIVKNCEFSNCSTDSASRGSGVIMGNYNEELFVRDTCIYNNRDSNHTIIPSIVGEQEILGGYYYESEQNHAPMLRRKKF